jgi:hypothetical protein
VPRTAPALAEWWAGKSPGRAVLILGGLSLREAPGSPRRKPQAACLSEGKLRTRFEQHRRQGTDPPSGGCRRHADGLACCS